MTPAARVRATAVAVAAFGYAVLHNFVIQPLTWRIQPEFVGLYIGLMALVSTVALPVLAYFCLTRRLRPRPATFTLANDPAFVVPESPMYRGTGTIVLMVMAGNLIPAERVPDSDHMRLSTLPGFVPALVLESAALAVVVLVFLWLPSSSVLLTPTGVTARYLFYTRRVRWEDLFPGGPPPTVRWNMPLRYRDRAGRAKQLDILLFSYHVDREFLATVVRHYAERPEHRPDIGTQAELDRLTTGFHRRRRPVAAARLSRPV